MPNPANPARRNRTLRYLGLAALVCVLLGGIFWLATYINEDVAARELVQSLGYGGVLLVSYIAGLNAIVPIPAGSFVPIFIAAGLSMPLIIATLVVGTTLADLTAFLIGYIGRQVAHDRYPKIQEFTAWLQDGKAVYIIPGVFLYAAFSPLPNELILIPLALAGVRLTTLIVPLFLGTIVYQTAFALGSQGIFELLTQWG